jgi:RNA polymerase sigma-70 factor, ECF subfamily
MTVPKSPPTAHSDDELLRLMRAGDESAFLALYRRWQGGIYRFALRMSGSEALAEDVTQEVFMALMRDCSRFDAARGSLGSYLYGVARNQVLRRLERDRPYLPLDVDGDDEGAGALTHAGLMIECDLLGDLARGETIQAVRDAVFALPPHYREVVALCELGEMNYADAAAALGCAIGTVRSRLHRARALLVEKLRGVNQSSGQSSGQSGGASGGVKQAETRGVTSARCGL